ncbi:MULTISPECIES: cytochrome c oxidase subunit 4 [Nesterenkonia]|uniref:aa3-type cytochrome oxidase subunit IV n=1 Tax=Nesterenkonia TaxID=57494 RepID=UPI0011B5B9B8|nr:MULTISPECIES: cytochrome c oxidase subunit 4 [Nesterenkonia]
MRTNIALFGGIGAFVLLVAVIYAFITLNWATVGSGQELGIEWVGFICLLLTAGLGFMLWWYLRSTAKHQPEVMDADNPEGEIHQMTGNYGEFTPWSWWPLGLGGALAFMFFGFAVDWWVFMFSLIPILFFISGWVLENNRGHYRH